MPGQKNFLDKFLDWAIMKGKKPDKGEKPSEPMSPIGMRARFRLVRRILVNLGYIKVKKISNNGYRYSVWPAKGCKRIYNINVDEIVDWFDNEFPILKTRKDKQRKTSYVIAIWKFGEYLVYKMKDSHGNPFWKKYQLQQLKEEIRPSSIEKFEVKILPLKKIDGLIEFIKDRNITHYTMIYLSRWLGGMRYQEVINAPMDLRGPTAKINYTLDIDFEMNKTTIYGKGKGGLQKPRYPTLLPEVKEILMQYLKIRKKIQPATEEDAKYLFLTQYGKKWSQHSGHLNDALRNHARTWGKLTEEEISLISTHKIGRHGFGTYFYPRMPEKLLMEEMGLEDPQMLHRYSNISREQRAQIMKRAREKDGVSM